MSLPDKSCDSDPLPTWLLKANASLLAPFIARLVNESLASGQVPAALKSAYVVPRLKKPDMDEDDVKNYRPISNLPVLAKLLERIVAKQLINYPFVDLCHIFSQCIHDINFRFTYYVNDLVTVGKVKAQ